MSENLKDMNFRLSVLRCHGIEQIRQKLGQELEKYYAMFPRSKDATILLKPNLNSYMNALTGNTTDLRILVVVIEFLKGKGYHNLIIGEGTSSGFYREKINIFSRLYIDRLAKFYGIKIIDLNYSPSEDIEFEYGIKAKVARICREADFFINLPKLKTHFETGVSVCLKNMMGTLVGLASKQKAHRSLFKNILNLNKYIKPNLHIVDGLIAMEGNGPSSGIPFNLGIILIGTDPYLVDLACARLAGFDYRDIPYLKIALDTGIVDESYVKFIDSFVPESAIRKLQRPNVNWLVKFINNPNWQHYFVKIRLAPGFNRLFSTKLIGKLLNITGLRQDVFIKEDAGYNKISVIDEECNDCKKCLDYCPMGLLLPQELKKNNDRCIGCLYCFLVCPKHAIKVEGELGFLLEQLKRYDEITRSIV